MYLKEYVHEETVIHANSGAVLVLTRTFRAGRGSVKDSTCSESDVMQGTETHETGLL